MARMAAPRYRLKLSRLDFISPVDDPAQPHAKTLLIKRRKKTDDVSGEAKLVKVSDELGLAFFWAFTSTNPDGTDHFDLQGDNIDQDFIKAAADFMLNGGATDEMHNGTPDGRVVFAMPMTPEIAKAFGVVTKTSGLMVALKPSAPVMAKLKSGEYSGVSIAGLGVREAVKGRRASLAFPAVPPEQFARAAAVLTKDMGDLAVTSLADGHQHTVDPDDVDDDGAGRTSYATGTGANDSYGHSHEWVTDENGVISIVANAGHTHTVDATVTVSDERSVDTGAQVQLVPAEGIGDGPGAISARRRTADLRTEKTAPSVTSTMTDLEIAKLKADLLKAEQRATLTDSHRTHLSKLSGVDVDTFLAKGHAARDAEMTDRVARDPEVYKSKSTGRVFRASDDPMAVEMAKQLDTNNEELAKMRTERDDATFAKAAADTLGGLPFQREDGKFDDAIALIKAVHTIADPVQRARVLTALKGVGAIAKMGGTAQGIGGDGQVFGNTGPEQTFDVKRDEFAKAAGMKLGSEIEKARATSAFIKTADGARAFQAYNASKPAIAVAQP